MQKRTAFLIRCSTKKQDYDRQVRDLTRVATDFGYELPDESTIYGEHITGKDDATQRDRLSIQHLKEGIKDRLFDVVLVSEASRMSRDPTSGLWYVRQFTNLNMPVYFKDLNIWTINPNTGLKNPNAESILNGAFMSAAKYLTSMKTQIASGRRAWLEQNQLVIGHPQFGYKKLGGKDKYTKNTVIVDEEKAPIVKDIFESYIQDGATLKSVALSMTAKYGITFRVSRIEQILTRTEYHSGEYKVTTTDPDTKEQEVFTVTFPPIIDKELYEKATTKRKSKCNHIYPTQKTHLLTRLIKCPLCGHSFSPRKRAGDTKLDKYRLINGKVAYSWYCMSRINNVTECRSSLNINNEKLVTVIWELIKSELIYSASTDDSFREEKISEISEKISNLRNDIKNYKGQVELMNRKIDKAYKAYMDAPDEVSDRAEYLYHETLLACKKEKDEAQTKINAYVKSVSDNEKLLDFYSQPKDYKEIVKEAESDETKMRKLFVELIIKILPYKVSHGLIVFEVYTICGIYYILLNGNDRGYERKAYYVEYGTAYYQNGLKKNELEKECNMFFLPKPILVTGEEGEPMLVDFSEMCQLCEVQGWTLTYCISS